MGETSKIEWTDATFNPWIGCAHVHAGCTHCYAESFAKRYGKATWGPNGTRVKTGDAYWRKPLKWNREAERDGVRRRVFCASLADVFEEWEGPILDHHWQQLYGIEGHREYETEAYLSQVKHEGDWRYAAVTMDDLRLDFFRLIDETPWLTWLVLTKRPQNVRRMWPNARLMPDADPYRLNGYRPNVWLGTSVSNQLTADAMVPELLKCRDLCPVLFLSAEPLLGPVDILKHIGTTRERKISGQAIYMPPATQWVIVGGESGHGARPFNIEWARSIRNQCKAAGVACFIKQLGTRPHCTIGNNHRHPDWVSWCKLKDPKGGDWSEWPEDLRVRQFPQPHGGSHA